MDFFNKDNDEDDENLTLSINDLESFINEIYLFSVLNLDVSLLPIVNKEKDAQKRSQLKASILLNLSFKDIDKHELNEMKRVYPIAKAEELVKSKVINNGGVLCILENDVSNVVEEISRQMLYSLMDEMHKNGLVELCWDSNKGDFSYVPKKGNVRNEAEFLKSHKKKKTRKPRKKKE